MEIKGIEETVEKQLKIINHFSEVNIANLPGDDLTRAAIALATNNAYLGQVLAEEEYRAGMMKIMKDSARIDEYSRLRQGVDEATGKQRTQKDAELGADKYVLETEKEEMEMKRAILKVKNLRNDCRDLLTAIQTRLSHLKQERMDALMPNAN